MKTMRIAMIGQKGVPTLYGGIERHVEDLSRELVKQGHEVLAYARSWYTPETIKEFAGIKIIHTRGIRSKHLDAISHTITATVHAIKQKVDVIHYHGVGPALLSWIPRVFAPEIKIITTFHCIDRYHQKWGTLAKLALSAGEWAACNFADETIAVSRTIQNYCFNEFQKTTTYIPNGVTSAEYPTGADSIRYWKLEPNKYLVMVARLVKHKGAHYLVDAWKLAKKQNPDLMKDYKLAIVGDSVFTDDYVTGLKKMAENDDSIVFTGWKHNQALTELFANAKMMVHPSENEGMSLSVLRAMSMGKPVLASDIPEQQELINDKKFLFANANIHSLANKILEL
ncbi:MAG: glycosyltransferase family 4 protein, partial [bacterium]